MGYALRDYQFKGKTMISRAFAQGHKKVMLWAMTGAGKGFQMSDFNETAINAKQKVLNVMKRRAIIFQTIENYAKYHGLKASPIMGTLKGQDHKNFCQVASIDTLRSRIKKGEYDFLKEFDLIIIDECHDLTSDSYKTLIWFLEGYEIEFYSAKNFEKCKASFKKYYIGLTATPYRVGNQAHTFWDVVVKPIEAHELRDLGVLVPTREFQPFTIDVKGIRLNKAGTEVDQNELFERCTQMAVIGNVVETYKKYGIVNGRHLPAIYFCVNKLHARIQTAAFNEAGIPARYCDDSHTQKERDKAKADLKSGVISILLNVNLFACGFDAPFIEVGGFIRYTESENLACQQWGRILRPYKICARCSTEYGGDPTCFKCGSTELKYEKKFAIMLDHAGNMSRHPGKEMIGNSVVYAIREAELNQRDIDHKIEQIGNKPKECPDCDGVLFPGAIDCEYCGYIFGENDEFQVLEREGELVEADAEFLREQLKAKIVARFNGYQVAQYTRRWDNSVKYIKIYEDFGDDIFMLTFKLGIKPEYEKILRQKGVDKRKKELNDNVNKLIDNLNYVNKAVVNE